MPTDLPPPQQGDLVLFSSDCHAFTSPCVGWVIGERGENAVKLLVFTSSGFVEKSGVHHKDDPRLAEMPGWEEFGVWDYAPSTKRFHHLQQAMSKNDGEAKPARK